MALEPRWKSFRFYGKDGFDERALDPEDLKLIECQVDTWAGCVFINMDPEAPPLLEAMKPLPDMLDSLLIGEMRVDWWKAVRLNANWKIAMEAFMEGWHVMRTHPQLTMGAGEEFPSDFLSVQNSYKNGHASLEQGHDNEVQADLGLSGKSEADKTLAFMRTLHDGLKAQVLAKDIQVIEGLRNSDFSADEFSAKMTEALYAWNKGQESSFLTRTPRRSLVGAASGLSFQTSCSIQSLETPFLTASAPTVPIPSTAISSFGP